MNDGINDVDDDDGIICNDVGNYDDDDYEDVRANVCDYDANLNWHVTSTYWWHFVCATSSKKPHRASPS